MQTTAEKSHPFAKGQNQHGSQNWSHTLASVLTNAIAAFLHYGLADIATKAGPTPWMMHI